MNAVILLWYSLCDILLYKVVNLCDSYFYEIKECFITSFQIYLHSSLILILDLYVACFA